MYITIQYSKCVICFYIMQFKYYYKNTKLNKLLSSFIT